MTETLAIIEIYGGRFPIPYGKCRDLTFQEFLEYMRDNNIDFSKITEVTLIGGDLSEDSLDFLQRCTNLTFLQLSNVNLQNIPPAVWTLTNLTQLQYEFNPINYIPIELALLPNLRLFVAPEHSYEQVPLEHRQTQQIVNHCRAKLQRRWFAQYMFFALRCSDPVVHVQDMILVDLAYHMCFPGFPGS
jgi:hypothetical protein